MNNFIKVIAAVLISIILSITLSGQGKNFSTLLTVAVCTMVAGIAMSYIESVVGFILELQDIGELNGELVTVLLKSVGIAIISEITTLICNDSGQSSLGKITQFLGSAIILWLCIPMFSELLSLVEDVLNTI